MALKQREFASHVQMKRPNQAQGIASFDEDEDDLEMERNFALFNQPGPVQQSEKDEEDMSGEESNEAVEDAENTDEENNYSEDSEKEHGQAESTDMTGSADSHNQIDFRRNNTKTEFEQGEEISADATLINNEKDLASAAVKQLYSN